jgi:hypothetical protein
MPSRSWRRTSHVTVVLLGNFGVGRKALVERAPEDFFQASLRREILRALGFRHLGRYVLQLDLHDKPIGVAFDHSLTRSLARLRHCGLDADYP